MKFFVEVDIMPLKALLDPQGKAVNQSLNKIGFESVANVRIGKHVNFEIEANSKVEAEEKVAEVCNKVLTNPIMEGFSIKLTEM